MQAKKVLFDTRWIGQHGIGRFAQEVYARLESAIPMPNHGKPSQMFDPFYISWVIRKLKPDLYFSPGYNPPFYLSTKIPFIFTLHDLTHLKIKSDLYLLKKAYYEALVKPATKKARMIFTVSEHAKTDILNWTGIKAEQVCVVGNGVSAAFHPEEKKMDCAKPYLLYVGNRKPHKNIGRLIEAFALSHAHPDFNLVLSGKPDSAVMEQIAQLKLEESVDFLGDALSDKALAEAYRGAYASIMPSIYEGFGLPALESMACGTPVLAAKAAALPEVVQNGGLYFDPYDVESIATSIDQLVQNQKLRQQLAHFALERSTSFSWQKTADRINKALQSCV